MIDLDRRLVEVRERIAEACRNAGRRPEDVAIVAVTKGQPVGTARRAFEAGLADLGENFVADLERRREEVPEARWHFLGRVQSNKAARLAEVHLVHGLEPGRGARRLSAAAAARSRPVRALLEVDFTGRRQGVAPGEVARALDALRELPGVELVGLMSIAPEPSSEAARRCFSELRELRERHAPELPELSMGMSGDFPVAVEEGATMVRLGTVLFGDRPTTKET